MTVFFLELKRSRISLAIWSSAIAFMLGVCILIYPEMTAQMGDISAMFADMGNFTQAFGLDELNFGEFMGYFSIECGNVLGLGGALFSALAAVSVLSSEERDHTSEFLYTHPLSRDRILFAKGMSVLAQILILNLASVLVSFVCILIVDVEVAVFELLLLFGAYLFMQIEIAALAFLTSSYVRKGAIGIALGGTMGFYFLNIVSNLEEDIRFLKYITPFGYADGSYIVANSNLKWAYLAVGAILSVVSVFLAFAHYRTKDLT